MYLNTIQDIKLSHTTEETESHQLTFVNALTNNEPYCIFVTVFIVS